METSQYEGIIVLGAPRSGTTLVRRLLDAHPNICCPPETNLLSAASRFLNEDQFAGSLTVGVIPGLGFSGVKEREVLEPLRELVFGFFRRLAAAAGKKRWAEKTAFDSFHLDQIERLCGDSCRFICVFRHALDVVTSTKELCDKMETYLPELHAYIRRHASPFEAFAHAWVDINQGLLRFAREHPGSCIQVRYEDLVEDPAEQMSRVMAFLDEPADVSALVADGMAEAKGIGLGDWKTYETRKITKSSVGRWTRELSVSTVRRLAPIVNPTMGALGYALVEVDAPVSDEEARRIYQIGRMVTRAKRISDKEETE